MQFGNMVAAQTASFLESLAVGALLGFVYDMARVFRLITRPGRRALFVYDFLYMFAAAFVTFAFLMKASAGRLRLFLLLGEGLGFFLWYLTLGALTVSLARAVIEFAGHVLVMVWRPIRQFVTFAGGKARAGLLIVKKKLTLTAGYINSLLQKWLDIVYNLLQLIMEKFVSADCRRKYKESSGIEDKNESTKKPYSSGGADGVRGVSRVFPDKFSGGHSEKARDIR